MCVTGGNTENGEVENQSDYSTDGEVLYKTLWKLKDCAGPAQDGDDVTMIIKYDGLRANGTHGQMGHTHYQDRKRRDNQKCRRWTVQDVSGRAAAPGNTSTCET